MNRVQVLSGVTWMSDLLATGAGLRSLALFNAFTFLSIKPRQNYQTADDGAIRVRTV
jgi:hypothetical protein